MLKRLSRKSYFVVSLSLLGLFNGFSAMADGQQGASVGAPPEIQVACKIGSTAMNAPGNVCKATLSDCTTLFTDYKTKALDALSWRIYGYYLGVKIDLAKTNFECLRNEYKSKDVPEKLEDLLKLTYKDRDDRPHPCIVLEEPASSADTAMICSPAGVGSLTGPDQAKLEDKNQLIGQKLSCGSDFKFTAKGFDEKATLHMVSNPNAKGYRQNAFAMGARAWALKRAAYDVFYDSTNGLKTDLSNFQAVLQNALKRPSVKDSVVSALADLKGLNEKLVVAETATSNRCNVDKADLCSDTSKFQAYDPMLKLCSLKQSRMAVEQGSLHYLLLLEIQARADQLFDEWIKDIIVPPSQGSEHKFVGQDFLDLCSNNIYGVDNRKQFKGAMYAMSASCATDGSKLAGQSGVGVKEKADCSLNDKNLVARNCRYGQVGAHTKIPADAKERIELYIGDAKHSLIGGEMRDASAPANRDSYKRRYFDKDGNQRRPDATPGVESSYTIGLAGLFEARIRAMCKQTDRSITNSPCDLAKDLKFKPSYK